MKAVFDSGVRRAVVLLLLGCLLGTATVCGTIFISSPPAAAACTAHHVNVEAYEKTATRYGNRATVYVNTSATISSFNDSVFRSLFIAGSAGNDVEVGWTAHNGGHSGPTVYAEWVNRGTDSGPRFYTGYSLDTDSYYNFIVENVGHIGIFRFYVDGESSPFAYSPTMNFDTGVPLTNSEHYNSCDSLWTHWYNVNFFRSDGTWSTAYNDLECLINTSSTWYLHKISNSELLVNSSSSGSLC